MEIELYFVPEDKEGRLLKGFLKRNKIPYKEIITNEINILEKVARTKLRKKVSILKIRYSSSIGVVIGYNPMALKQLLRVN